MLRILSALSLLSALALTGCGLGTPATATPETMHLNITGSVHGGQQPVAGARIFVLQANNTGYGNGSVDLLAHAFIVTGHDATYNAYYDSTDANGAFNITGQYTCASPSTGPVYILATQGNPGLGSGKSNPALAELAVVANACNGGELPSNLQIGITEQSTVTGVYALAGYMTTPDAISSNGSASALSLTGITNAANTALGLTNVATGTPLATTAAGATIPTAKINLLADILAACVNTDGTTSTCGTLFTAAAPSGGTRPTDTVTALLNIAHNPALTTASLKNLYGLPTATSPYQPYSSTQPTDLTLALTYPPPSFDLNNFVAYNQPSIDKAGEVVIPGSETGYVGSVTVLANTGKMVSFNEVVVAVDNPQRVAIDPYGFAWFAFSQVDGQSAGTFYKLNLTTGSITDESNSNYTSYSNCIASDNVGDIFLCDNGNLRTDEFYNTGSFNRTLDSSVGQNSNGIAVDSAGYTYTASSAAGMIYVTAAGPSQYNGSGTSFNGSSSATLPNSLAIDSSSHLWVTGGNNSLAKYEIANQSTFSVLALVATYTGAGLSFNTTAQPLIPVIMDGASSAWVPNYAGQSISGFSNAGAALSPATTGFATGCQSKGLAVDGSGNVWVTCDAGTPAIVEFIGLATPVATPILPGQLGVRP